MEYVKDDLVIVFLSTQDRRTKNKCKYKICKVVVAGKYDMICETIGTFSKIFKVSKKRCFKIEMKNYTYLEHKPTPPKIGDLIMSVRDNYSSGRDTFTGIVENITYDPSDQHDPMYHIRIGQKTVRAYLENIIILESAS